MGDRFPSPRLPSPGQPMRSQDVSAFLAWVGSLQALQYVDVEGEFSGTATLRVGHGLGRAYRGGSVLWVSDVTVGLNVLDPAAASDAVTAFELGTVGGGAFTGTALVRLF